MVPTSNFSNLDLGSNPPIPSDTVKIEVQVSNAEVSHAYAEAFLREAERRDPDMFRVVDLTLDELKAYFDFLLSMRIKVIQNDCPEFRKLKVLWIPSFFQYVLSMIGIVKIRQFGLTITPVREEVKGQTLIPLGEAFKISNKLSSFADKMLMMEDAMPREMYGNDDVMSCVLLAGYVKATKELQHPAATYVSAFVNMTLKKEAAFKVLYMVQYDDIDFITMALSSERSIYG